MKTVVIRTRTAVIGSGCAGLNAADWLYDLGERDFVLLTDGLDRGTSRNTGSDKQTYYKLTLSGSGRDSVEDLARTLLAPDSNGDTALCEAAASAQCFYKLVSLGVPFPCNEFGEYAGYRTDHDPLSRATSAGPLTSRYMTQALEKSVLSKEVRILDGCLAFRLTLAEDGSLSGVLCYSKAQNELLYVECAHAILCTGGPAALYADSVYPESQHGMSGMALAAGAEGANLDRWQYGMASVSFRWNVSGSYQQALPQYVSKDENDTEREFLLDALSPEEAVRLCFLKGYEWPFDERKTGGSSMIDLLVKRETDKGRRVYLDFRHNPAGFEHNAGSLDDTARGFLSRSGALLAGPAERLFALNPDAIALYETHGIDLRRDMLEIRVCAQHHNGGLAVDADWQTNIKGLYAAGEAAGTFGSWRPGGSALNSTQAGSMRSAMHIAKVSKRQASGGIVPDDIMLPAGDPAAIASQAKRLMSRNAAFIRSREGMQALVRQVHEWMSRKLPLSGDDGLLEERIRLGDMLETQAAVLHAMLEERTCGQPGVLYTRSKSAEGFVNETRAARPLPDRDLWFENVWRADRARRDREASEITMQRDI